MYVALATAGYTFLITDIFIYHIVADTSLLDCASRPLPGYGLELICRTKIHAFVVVPPLIDKDLSFREYHFVNRTVKHNTIIMFEYTPKTCHQHLILRLATIHCTLSK